MKVANLLAKQLGGALEVLPNPDGQAACFPVRSVPPPVIILDLNSSVPGVADPLHPCHDRHTIGEMSDRARDVFRLVVEAYLDSGQPVGSRTDLAHLAASTCRPPRSATSCRIWRKPACWPRRTPRPAGSRPKAACACSSTASCRRPSRAPRSAPRSRALIDRGGPIEEAISNATAALSGLSACAGIVLVPKEEPVLRQLAFVPLSPRPGAGGAGRRRRQRRESRRRSSARRRRRRRSTRSAIMSARGSPA